MKSTHIKILYIIVRTVRVSIIMCHKCGYSTIKPYQAQESLWKMQLTQHLAGEVLNFINCVWCVDPNSTGGSTNTVEPEKETIEQEEVVDEKHTDTTELQKYVKDILGEDEFNKLSVDMQKDVLNKYDAYKNVLKLEGSVLNNRVKTYVKALQAHQIELEMGAYNEKLFDEALKEVAADPDAPTEEELRDATSLVLKKKQECEIKIQDDNIETQRQSGTDEEYYGALNNRGQGYVDMYDKDNDQVISFEEFKALQEKDSGRALCSEEIEATKTFFNRIDKNNNGIDANEMASHLYAVSRMHDKGNGPNTVADITLGEWLDSQKILSNENVSTRYDNIYNQLYGVLKPKE